MQSLGRPDQLEARLFGQLGERERERVKRFAAGVAGRRLWVPLPLRPRLLRKPSNASVPARNAAGEAARSSVLDPTAS
jgi:hypothetical protein